MHLYHVKYYGPEAHDFIRHGIKHGLSKPDPIMEDEITAPSRQCAEDITHMRGIKIPGASCFELTYARRIVKHADI